MQVEAGGRLEGTIAPADVLRALEAKVRLVSAADPSISMPQASMDQRDAGVEPDAEGRFAFDGIAPGDWTVVLVFRGCGLRCDPIGTVADVRSGATSRFEARIDDLRPGRLRGRLFVNGEPRSRCELRLHATPPPGQVPVFFDGNPVSLGGGDEKIESDAAGAFDTRLLPGTYHAWIPSKKSSGIDVPQEIVIAPGATVDLDLSVKSIRVVVRVLDASSGEPVANRRFRLDPAPRFGTAYFTSDAAGEIVLDPAPLASFELRTLPASLTSDAEIRALADRSGAAAVERAMIRLGPFQVKDDEKQQLLEVKLKDR